MAMPGIMVEINFGIAVFETDLSFLLKGTQTALSFFVRIFETSEIRFKIIAVINDVT